MDYDRGFNAEFKDPKQIQKLMHSQFVDFLVKIYDGNRQLTTSEFIIKSITESKSFKNISDEIETDRDFKDLYKELKPNDELFEYLIDLFTNVRLSMDSFTFRTSIFWSVDYDKPDIVFRIREGLNLKADPFEFFSVFDYEEDIFETGLKPFENGSINLDPKIFQKYFDSV